MENKQQDSGVVYPSDSGADVSSAPPVATEPAFDPQALSAAPELSQPLDVVYGTKSKSKLRVYAEWGSIAAVVVLLVGGLIWWAANSNRRKVPTTSVNSVSQQYDTVKIPLSELALGGGLDVSRAKVVNINGSLTVQDGFVIAPSSQPKNAQVGQLYFDEDSNSLAYFNGTEFVIVAGQSSQVVEQVAGLTGQIALGPGLASVGGQLANSGVLSVQGETGAVTFTAGNGIAINGTLVANTGVISVASSSPSITVTDDGNGNITLSGSGSGTISSVGGTNGRIAKFVGAQEIADSLLSESGATITVNGNLAVTGSVTLGTPLAVASGGSGAASLAANGVLIGNGTAAFTSVVAGGAGLCLVSTAGVPAWGSCTNGSNAVTSLNGLTGGITIANASGSGSIVTIDDAATMTKGIASFNGTNFTVVGGNVNTVQNINTTATPTFSGVNTNSVTSSGALTIGSAAQALSLLGNASSVFAVTGGGQTTTVGFSGVPTGAVNYNFDRSATAGTYTICTTAANCAGVGGGVTTAGGTTDRLSKFTGSQTIGDSSISDNGSLVTLLGSANLLVQGGTATLGTTTQAGSIVLSDGSSNTVTVVLSGQAGDRVYTLPDVGGNADFCLSTGNCAGGSGAPANAAYLVATLNGGLSDERALAAGSNISLTDGGPNANMTVATVNNPTFSTSVTTPLLQSSGVLSITSAGGNAITIAAGTTIELQDDSNVTGNLDVSGGLNVGSSNAFVVNSSGAITAATGVTSSGTVTFSALNCTTFANGGALTTNGSGVLSCTDDDGGGGITGSGTAGNVPLFSAAQTLTNSIITQTGTTIDIAGDLTLDTALTVGNGGTGATSFTSNGVVYGNGSGALQVTAAGTGGQVLLANGSGVPTFTSFSGDVTVTDAGATAIQANSVALSTDTTGDYVSSLGTLTGLSTSGNSGEGSTPTLSVSYGAVANTAVQGNVTLTCPSGTGNLTGGGTSITLGSGGACGNISIVNNPTFTTSVTTPSLVLTGAGSNGTIQVSNLGQATLYTLPDPAGASTTICIATGNCTAAGSAGGDLTGTYPNPTIASLQGTDLNITSPVAGHVLVYNDTDDEWQNVAISGDIVIDEDGVSAVQANAVALTTDTTGNYVLGVTAGNGINVSGSAGEGWSPSIAVIYGSAANTAVQGNTSITVTAGTNLTGGGSITLGTGGSVTVNVANSPTFSGTLVVQGATATIGTTSQQGSVVMHDGNGETGTIETGDLNQNTVFTLPDPGAASATFCLNTGNCIGGTGAAPNAATYLVASANATLTNERVLAAGTNVSLTDGGAGNNMTVATVNNPTFSTSVTTPILQSSGGLSITSAAGQTVAIDAGTTIELQDSTNVTGSLDVSAGFNAGTSNAFVINSSGAITAATGIASSGTITFSGLDCTSFANGGALTTNGSGVLSCSDDDGGAGSAISGTGTAGTIALFSAAQTIADSIITQSGGNTIDIAGTLTLDNELEVAEGGTGAVSFTTNGVLFGNGAGDLQVTAAGTGGQVLVANGSGVPTFVSFSGDVSVSATGATTIQANSVALGTDTTGDYVMNLGTLTGLTTSGNSGEGSTPTLSVSYGSIANTAVQGNVTLTCPSGTGNLTGGGTSITLGTGGACGDLNTVNNPTFTTSVTTPSMILTGAGSDGTIQVGNLGQGTVYTLPDPGGAAATICISTGNCTTAGAAGGDLTGNYPNPTIAKLQGTDLNINTPTAGHVLIYNDTDNEWQNVALSGDITVTESGVVAVQANAVALGTDTTGNYVLGVNAGNGINVSGSAGEGWTPTVEVVYGSSANTAVQGNTSITITAGTNLTGGGSITLGAGGSVTVHVANSPTFSGTLTVQGATATIGQSGTQGGVVLYDGGSGGAAHTGTLQVIGTLGQNTTFTLPDPGGASATVCVSTGNCAGAGGGVTTAGGTTDRVSKFTSSQAIGDSSISDDGTDVIINGSVNLVVQGGAGSFGTTTQAGSLVLSDGSSNTVTIAVAALSADRVYTLPDAGGDATLCVNSGNCLGGTGGAPNAAQYLVAALDGTLTNERALAAGSNISLTDGGAGANMTVATVQNPTFTTSVTTPLLQSSGALDITSAGGTAVTINAGTSIDLQDNTSVTGTLTSSSTLTVSSGGLTVSAGGASITGNTTIATTGGNTLSLGNGTGALTVTGNSSTQFVINGVTVDATEFNRLDGKDAALVDTNDAVNTAITGTGALDSGSITANFGSIDTGADNITTTGTIQGTTAILTGSLDQTTSAALNIGATTATSIVLGKNTSLTGSATFTSGTGTVLLQGNTDIANTVSFATRRAATYTTAGSADDVALNVASLYLLDTSGAAQTITGIVAGRDGQHLTLVNADASLAVTLSNLNAGSAPANQISTGTGTDIAIPAGGSINLVYDTANNLWRVVGGVAGGNGTCSGCANTALSNLSGVNLNTALNRTGGDLSVTTTTSGNIVLDAAGTIQLQDNTNVTGTLTSSSTLTVSAGGASIAGNTTIATTGGNTLSLGNATGALTVTGDNGSSFNLNGVTVDDDEFNRLDGKDAALVDTNDAVGTAITGTGALASGSITSGFGAIDTGADNITTTGTVQGTTAVLTGSLDQTTAAALNIGATTATSIVLGKSTTMTGAATFTSGTGTVLLQGNTDIASSVSFATRRGTTYTTPGSADDVALNVASLYILDTSGAAQTLTGIVAGRDGQYLTLVNGDASATVTLANMSGSSSAGNQISTGTGSDISIAAGGSISLIYDSSASLWRVVGGVAGGNGTCSGCANTSLSNLSSVNINTALNTTAGNLNLTTTTSGNIVLDAAGTIQLQDNTSVTGTFTSSSTLTVSAGGASIAGNTTIATTGGNTLSLGNATGTLAVTGDSGSQFVINGVTVDATEFGRLDGKDAALVDTNDAVSTAIIGTGALASGSISSGFGAIDTGADNITTTGTVQGTAAVLTGSLDQTTSAALNIGATTATSIVLGKNTTMSGAATFTSGTGTVLLQGNTDIASGVSLATRRGTTYTAPGSADDVALNVASLYILDTSGAAQTITGIVAGRDGQFLTLVNGDASLAVTLSNQSSSSAGNNRISTGTGADISLPVGGSISLIYDSNASLWRVIGGAAGGSGTCSTCANTALSNLSGVNINTALNATGANLNLTTTTSGNIVLTSAGIIDLQDNTTINGTLGVGSTLTITTGGLTVSAGGASIAGNTTIATTGGNTLGLGNSTGALTVTGNSSSSFVIDAVTIGAAEFNRLDGKDAALVDTNDAVATAITGTGALASGSITSGFGAIDTGADNITTTGTIQGTTGVLTGSLDQTTSAALNIGASTATSIVLGKNTTMTGAATFTSGTGLVLLQGNTDIASTVSFATRRGTTYTTAGSANDVALNVASLYILDTSGAAQTITGIVAGRDGQYLTLVNGDASLAVTLADMSGSSSAGNQISTGTGANVSIAAGASISLIYDSNASLWRVVGGVAGGNGTCSTCANTALSNLSGVNLNTALNRTGGDLSVTTTTSGNIVLDAAGTIQLQDNTNVTGTLTSSSTLTVSAGGASIAGNTTIATTAGNTLSLGNATGTLTVAGDSGTSFAINGGNVSATEFNRLDGKDAALVDTNDAVSTAITGTGALASGSITSGFGAIDTGADNITTTGTIQGTTGVLTGSLDQTTGAALNIGATTATSIVLGKDTSLTGAATFTSGTGTVLLQGNIDVANSVSFATRRGTTYTTAGSANNVALNVASLYVLDTSGAAQTITGIVAGRDGQHLTLINGDATLAVTISNMSGSSSAGNQISTGTGADISMAAGASISLVYDSNASLWRVVGGVAGGNGTCSTCANTALSNLSGVNINTALNATNADLSLTTTTSGNIVLTSAGNIQLQDNTSVTGTLGVSSTLTVTTGGLTVSAGGASIAGNTTIATTAGNTLSLGNATGTLAVTGDSGSSFVINGVNVSATEFNRLDGKDAALVDTNDAVTTAITGTGALGAGSITSGFGAIDTGADNITTTGTVQGTAGVLTGSLDQTTGAALNIGATTATSIVLGKNTSLTGTATFTSGTGLVQLQGNTDITNTVSFATRRAATYTTAGSANDVALSTASLYILDTSGVAQTITGIVAGRDGQHLTLVNADASLAVTLSDMSNSSSADNRISTGTGTDVMIPAGGSISLIYDDANNLWRVVGGLAAGNGTCTTCANVALSNLSSVNINAPLNRTGGDLSVTTTTSGNIVLDAAGTIQLQDNTSVSGTLGVSNTLTVSAGGASIVGNTTIATTAGNTLGLGNSTGAVTVTGSSISLSSGSGTITVGGGTQTGTIDIGTGTGVQSVNIGTGGTGAKTVAVGSTASTSSLAHRSGTGGQTFAVGSSTVATIDGNTGAVLLQNAANSTSAFQIQNAGGTPGVNVDTTTVNLITNHSFEVNTAGWTALGAATLSRVTTEYYDNNASMQVATTAAANDGARYNYSLASSTQYSLQMKIKNSVGGFNALQMGYSEDGSTQTSCATNLTAYTTYFIYFTCTFTTGTVSGTPYIYLKQIDSVARNTWIDAVQLETGGASTVYRNSRTAFSGNVVINGGQPLAATNDSSTAALVVRALSGSNGVHIYGNGDGNVFRNAFVIASADGAETYMSVNDAARMTHIQGGSNFFNTPALGVNTLSADARALDVNGALGQSTDIMRVKDSTGDAILAVGPVVADLFGDKTDYATAADPRGTVIGDWDKDGDLDLVVTNSGSNNISVFMNNGSGVYGTGTTAAAGTGARAVIAGDWDKDGDLDLAVANTGTTTVSIMSNNGSGTFSSASTPTVGTAPFSLTAADWDKDGDLDLAVANNATSNVTILLNNGSGSFSSGFGSPVSTGISNPRGITSADFDKDGDIDWAVTSTSGILNIFLNNGSGFTAGSTPTADTLPYFITHGDFDRDGDIDLAVANDGSTTVSIFPNNGSGSFSARTDYFAGEDPTGLTAADLDKDGDLDLAFTNDGTGTDKVSYLLNGGNGVFAARISMASGDGPHGIAAADLDKDGDIDMAVSNADSDTVSVYLGSSLAVSPISAPTLKVYSGGVSDALQIRTVDNKRLLSVDSRGNTTIGNSATADGELFAPKVDYTTGNTARGITYADLDKDGDLDLVTATSDIDRLSVFMNNGRGQYAPKVDLLTDFTPYDVVSGDWDRDGDIDLTTTDNGSNEVSTFLNNGDGTFGGKNDAATTGNTGPRGLAAGDFNKDGDLDLVVATYASANLSIMSNNGSGTFSITATLTPAGGAFFATTGDVDKDGDIDIVSANNDTSNISVFKNNGSGTFSLDSSPSTGTAPRYVVLADFDKDGDLDAATANIGAETLSVLLNNGNGTYATNVDYPVVLDPIGVTAADFDKDGHLDLIASNFGTSSISVLHGTGGGAFDTQTAYTTGSTPYGVVAADFDKDGDPDVATANTGSANMSVLMNNTLTDARFKVISGDSSAVAFSVSSTGLATFQTTANSTTGFVVLNASSVPQFTVDTSNSRVYIGNPTADTTGALLVLDTSSDSADPTGVNGAMYYNSNLAKFRCYENGSWVNCISSAPQTVVFTTSNTFVKANYPGLKGIMIEVVGAGGGSGGAATTAASQAAVGGGGGGGGYCKKFITVASLATNETVTVGTGGSGGTAGANSGGTGGNSSFGSFCTGNGGAGGSGGTAVASGATLGGVGGTSTGGDVNIPGEDGSFGNVAPTGFPVRINNGGASILSGTSRPTTGGPGGAGTAGPLYGGGASGAINTASQGTARAGAAGADGVVIVTLFF